MSEQPYAADPNHPHHWLYKQTRDEAEAVIAAVEANPEPPRPPGSMFDHLTRERLAQEYDRAARSEHRRLTDNADYERGRADAFRIAASRARDNGTRDLA